MRIKAKILEALEEGPGLVCDLAAEFEMDARKLSANLVHMERLGLVSKRPYWKQGKQFTRAMVWLYSIKEAA